MRDETIARRKDMGISRIHITNGHIGNMVIKGYYNRCRQNGTRPNLAGLNKDWTRWFGKNNGYKRMPKEPKNWY